jgi:hypothetical protein
MNNQTAQQVKYTFACDLAVYLTCIILNNIPKEDHQIAIEKVMNNWSQRIEKTRLEILNKIAPQVAQEQGVEVDVAAVLIDAHNIEGKMLKGEFKKEIRELMLKTIVAPQIKRAPVRKKIMGG